MEPWPTGWYVDDGCWRPLHCRSPGDPDALSRTASLVQNVPITARSERVHHRCWRHHPRRQALPAPVMGIPGKVVGEVSEWEASMMIGGEHHEYQKLLADYKGGGDDE